MINNQLIVINLLSDRICENCFVKQDENSCCVWFESLGWIWMSKYKEGTCHLWANDLESSIRSNCAERNCK